MNDSLYDLSVVILGNIFKPELLVVKSNLKLSQ
jgi:hypothetical protein